MDLKVYEGYKHTSASDNSATTRSNAQTLSAFNQAFKTPAVEDQSVNPQPLNNEPINQTVTPPVNPQQVNAQPVSRNFNNKPRIALFIDVDNVGISRENLMEIIFYANGKYQIDQCRLYGFSDETLPGIREIAAEYNVTTVGKMKFKQNGVNCLDSRLLIDAYECALNNRQKIDMVFLWCYPCDLTELFEKIRALGVNTATIENNAFDCKNKFVSQTFKIYSPYDFTVEQSTYGKIRNQPAEIAPSENVEKMIAPSAPTENVVPEIKEEVSTPEPEPVNVSAPETSSNASVTEKEPLSTASESQPAPKEEVSDNPQGTEDKKPSILDDDFVPPVLPRRTIVERSSSRLPRKDPETNEENNDDADASLEKKNEQELNESNESNESEESKSPSSIVEEIARKLNLPVLSDEDIDYEAEEREEEKQKANNLFVDLLKQAGYDSLLNGEKTLKYEDTIGDL